MRTKQRTSRRRLGYTLAETMISLSITAALLAAMGGAFTAAGNAIEINDRYFRAVQQSRSGMNFIMTEIRRAQSITSASSTSVSLVPCATDCPEFGPNANAANTSITISYSNGNITLTPTVAGTTGSTYNLVSNVGSASFGVPANPGATYGGGATPYSSISLSMTVQIGNESITLSDSAAPRVYCTSLYQ